MQISRLLTSSDRSTTPISFSVCAVQNERKESARKREREREATTFSRGGERETVDYYSDSEEASIYRRSISYATRKTARLSPLLSFFFFYLCPPGDE